MESLLDSKREKMKQDYKEKQRMASLKREQSSRLRKLGLILNKDENDRTDEERSFLDKNSCFISIVESRLLKQNQIKQRTEEIEDDLNELDNKIDRLIELINESNHIMVYTGAGISTSSNIPDYRGKQGIWTQLNKNGSIQKTKDLALATPTYVHMALKELIKKNIVKHIVSQNCDGLHLRSGLRLNQLSEIHGNMFVEICLNCKKVHYRNFDVTEKTSLRHHRTGRFCVDCIKLDDKNLDCELIDTIVHFGEKGHLEYPLNWKIAVENVQETDLIICLGTSLKVLKNYLCLWPKKMKNDKKRKVNLVIINLQWTSKDSQATLKINAKCDLVMQKLMNKLNIKVDDYDKDKDRLKELYIPLTENEQLNCKRYQLFNTNIKTEIDTAVHDIIPGWYGKGVNYIKKIK